MKKTKKQTRKIFVTLGILLLVALATSTPNVSATWTSDAPIAVDTIIKKEGTGSIRVTSNQTDNTWNNVSSIVSGLGTMANESRPTVFKMGSTWYLISSNATDFKGFNWTGSTWQSDSAIISGLYPDADTMPAPNTFYKDSKWYLIVGNQTGKFRGYNWTGSAWQNDSVIASGLGDIGSTSTPFVFEKSGTWQLISGNSVGTFSGFKWNATSSSWESDSAIVSGLGDVGDKSSPSIFYKDSKWYLISGEQTGIFNGYNWTGSAWVTDGVIVEGTYQLSGSSYLGTVFEGSSSFGDVSWYLISGHSDGDFIGFYWTDEYTPTCYFQKVFTPAISVTNVSKNVGFLVLWYYTYNATKIDSYVNISVYTDDSNYMYWGINKTYFNNTWNDLYLPLSEGAEVGTLDLSSISKFRLKIPGTEDPDMVHRVDHLRFVEYPYTLHNIYLEPESEGGVGTYYPPPHLVEFRVQNTWGKVYSDALVTAQGYSTTMGTWDWLYSIFGFKNETQIHNATMSDTTDTNGHLSFLMIETVKYQINVSDTESPARFDSKTFWIYPKDERYNLVVSEGWKWQKAGTEEQKEMSINVTASTNDTHAFINISYNDPSNKTTYLAFYLNYTVDNNVEECLQSANWSNTSVKNHSFVLSEYEGRAFKIQVVTEHGEWGSRTWTYAKRFEGMLVNRNLPDAAYPMIAVAVLLFLGGVFGRSSATQGSLVICFGVWFFWAIGFLTMINSAILLSALSLASIVSIIAIMMEKSRKTGVQ